MRDLCLTATLALFATPALLLLSGSALAQVMQSPSYQIESDSLNIGGGLSSSTNYVQESTLGEIATGRSSSANYELRAGYQQMLESYIAITGTANVTLTPSIVGITGGISNGSTTVTVTTDNRAGYSLTIEASTSPAMIKGGDSIADYVPAGADPDFTFTTDVSDAHFGYSPSGIDIVARFLDNGSDTCNTGATDSALACWDGLSTTAETIAQSSSSNHPNGATTTVNFRVGIGSSVVQPPGVYSATTTLTALPL